MVEVLDMTYLEKTGLLIAVTIINDKKNSVGFL